MSKHQVRVVPFECGAKKCEKEKNCQTKMEKECHAKLTETLWDVDLHKWNYIRSKEVNKIFLKMSMSRNASIQYIQMQIHA